MYDPYKIVRLRHEIERLLMLVEQARESRDQADAMAKEAVQAEMAELRKTIAAARACLGTIMTSDGDIEWFSLMTAGEFVRFFHEMRDILSGGKGEA